MKKTNNRYTSIKHVYPLFLRPAVVLCPHVQETTLQQYSFCVHFSGQRLPFARLHLSPRCARPLRRSLITSTSIRSPCTDTRQTSAQHRRILRGQAVEKTLRNKDGGGEMRWCVLRPRAGRAYVQYLLRKLRCTVEPDVLDLDRFSILAPKRRRSRRPPV